MNVYTLPQQFWISSAPVDKKYPDRFWKLTIGAGFRHKKAPHFLLKGALFDID
jgi:hypothetical protein